MECRVTFVTISSRSRFPEAGFGITSAVDQSLYGNGQPNISRTLFLGCNAVTAFYTASTWPGSELYHP
jgi:hypothetical protein